MWESHFWMGKRHLRLLQQQYASDAWLGSDPAAASVIILSSTTVLLEWVYLDVAGRH